MVAQETTNAQAAMVRALDKMTGAVVDLEIPAGQVQRFGRIEITVQECRFPTNNPAGDAYVLMNIREIDDQDAAFFGWMVASSPALNALDHARYDVWALRCITS
nr:DUF2155 domain-containing protein [Pseudaestuariivita rosea]